MPLSAAAICSLDTLKGFLGIDLLITTQDPLLTSILEATSAGLEKRLGRVIRTRALTEVYDGPGCGRSLFLRAFPVTAIAAIHLWDAAHTEMTTLTPSDGEAFFNARTGEVQRAVGDFGAGFQTVEVDYTAGLGVTEADLPDDLLVAALHVMKYTYDRHTTGTTAGNSVSVGSMTFVLSTAIPADVRDTLDAYRRGRI